VLPAPCGVRRRTGRLENQNQNGDCPNSPIWRISRRGLSELVLAQMEARSQRSARAGHRKKKNRSPAPPLGKIICKRDRDGWQHHRREKTTTNPFLLTTPVVRKRGRLDLKRVQAKQNEIGLLFFLKCDRIYHNASTPFLSGIIDIDIDQLPLWACARACNMLFRARAFSVGACPPERKNVMPSRFLISQLSLSPVID
jgi:hypothetical protein